MRLHRCRIAVQGIGPTLSVSGLARRGIQLRRAPTSHRKKKLKIAKAKVKAFKAKEAVAHVAVEEEDDDADLEGDRNPTRKAMLDMLGFCKVGVTGIGLLETGTQTKRNSMLTTSKKVSFADIVQNGVSKASQETKRLTLDTYCT